MAGIAAILAVALTGCSTSDKYRVMQRRGSEGTIPVKAAVTDFEDARGRSERYHRGTAYIPLNLYGGYFFYDRHDAKYPTQTQPFPTLLADRTAARLQEAAVFESTTRVASPGAVSLGEADVLVEGRINKLRTTGRLHYWGLSIFGDLLHYLGVPAFHRRWHLDVEYQLVDAYTGNPIGEPIRATLVTPRRFMSKYSNRGEITDLEKQITPAFDALVAHIWEKLPNEQATEWAQLKQRGRDMIEARDREAAAAVEGRRPRFRFLAPTDGDTVRGASTTVRWDAVAPARLKSAVLVVNNEVVNLGVNPLDLMSAASAPTELQARTVEVPIKMGSNRLEALVEDHLGDQTRASLNLVRLPQLLTPPSRHALLIGAGSDAAAKSVDTIAQVLTDPLIGQFPADRVTALKSSTTINNVTESLANFGGTPRLGDLVFIYLATDGTWSDLSILGGTIQLDDFIRSAAQSLATTTVVMVADINWDTTSTDGRDLYSRIESVVPAGWAIMTPQSTGGAAAVRDGERALAVHLAETMRSGLPGRPRITVENLLDQLLVAPRAGDAIQPATFGRYTQNNTMVERE
jgi:hypothetical protein